jgi:hypothetical protein
MDLKLGKYKHSKSGNIYTVIGIARHSETLEELVVYQAHYYSNEFGNAPIFARPIFMFTEVVTVNGKEVPRFEYIDK